MGKHLIDMTLKLLNQVISRAHFGTAQNVTFIVIA